MEGDEAMLVSTILILGVIYLIVMLAMLILAITDKPKRRKYLGIFLAMLGLAALVVTICGIMVSQSLRNMH